MNARSRKTASTFGLLGVLLSFVGACSAPYQAPSLADARTPLILLDVTSAGKSKAESYWQMPGTQSILRCYHDRTSSSGVTGDAHDCQPFDLPSGLPKKAVLLAMNMGSRQKTQSVWDINGDGGMNICTHDTNWLSGGTLSTADCQSFKRPDGVSASSVLATMNSGSGIVAQTFWNGEDGSIVICNHQKVSNWLFGSDGFGDSTGCTTMAVTVPLFPAGVVKTKLVGATSDVSRPWETFWQDANGVVLRCKHDRFFVVFQDASFGAAQSCDFWRPPLVTNDEMTAPSGK